MSFALLLLAAGILVVAVVIGIVLIAMNAAHGRRDN